MERPGIGRDAQLTVRMAVALGALAVIYAAIGFGLYELSHVPSTL